MNQLLLLSSWHSPITIRFRHKSPHHFLPLKRRINLPLNLKLFLVIALTLTLILTSIYTLISFTQVKQVICSNYSPPHNSILENLLTQTFQKQSLILITTPKIQTIFQNLYLNPPTSITKKYPSTLVLDCQNTNLKAFLTLTHSSFTPTSLSSWIKLAQNTFSSPSNPNYLLIFQKQKNTLNLLPVTSPSSLTQPHFFVFNLSDHTLSLVWATFFWLQNLNSNQNQYKILVTPFSVLIFDPNTNLYYLLDPQALPSPQHFTQTINQLHSKTPNFKIIDWRFNRLTIF